MTERSYRGVLWTLALLGALADQGTKYSIFAMLYNNGEGGEYALIPGAFDLLAQYTRQAEEGTDLLAQLRTVSGKVQPRVNHGALFGFGGEHALAANYVFAAVSLLAATAILFWSTRRSLARDRLLCVALGLILGGTLGNLYDRLVFNGVRDFLRWHYAFEWPVFNIADCCLVTGAGLLLIQALATRPVVVDPEGMPSQEVVQSPVSS